MKPTLGRIVHYVPRPLQPDQKPRELAAIVTAAHGEDMIDLYAFEPWPGGLRSFGKVRHAEDKQPGTWHWPEREEQPSHSLGQWSEQITGDGTGVALPSLNEPYEEREAGAAGRHALQRNPNEKAGREGET